MPFSIPPDAANRVLVGLRRVYPDFEALPHDGFSRDEDAYKRAVAERVRDVLAPAALDDGRAANVHAGLADVLTMRHGGHAFNLAGWRDTRAFERIAPEPFVRALGAYLHDGPATPERFAALFEATLSVKAEGGSAWTLATLFPHLYRPAEDAFVKPEHLRQALALLGQPDAKRLHATTAEAAALAYADVLSLYHGLLAALAPLGARDFVDVQGLLYVAARPDEDEGAALPFRLDALPDDVRAFARRYASHLNDVFRFVGPDDPRLAVTDTGESNALRVNVGMWAMGTFRPTGDVQIVLHEDDRARLFPHQTPNLFAHSSFHFCWTTLAEAERPEVVEAWQKAVQMASELEPTQRGSSWRRAHRPGLAAWLFDAPASDALFTPEAFALLERLSAEPTKAFYDAHKDALQQQVREPMKRLFASVADRLPAPMRAALNTTKQLVSNVLKQFVQHGAYDYVWGAFTPEGIPRREGPQLYAVVHHTGFAAGFSIGANADVPAQHLARALAHDGFARRLEASLDGQDLRYARTEEDSFSAPPGRTFGAWRAGLADRSFRHVVRFWTRDEAARLSLDALADALADLFVRLYPLVEAAHTGRIPDDPEPEPDLNPVVTLAEVAEATHLPEARLREWVAALRRKRQAIFYGPPGTGKTFVAHHLADHLVGGGDGFVETLQFHPAYAYEDFVQGLRPVADGSGAVRFDLVPGRLLDVVRRARAASGPCVLVLDEINRADLARVFGELMYLLEYRGESVPLAGGGHLTLPENLLLLGTMNTADRSVALVDHALRRRFAFFSLAPDYGILTAHFARHHAPDAARAEALRRVLDDLNRAIDDPHLALGVSFFLPPEGTPDVGAFLREAWTFEIEPYLEELFHGQPDALARWRWDAVADRLGGGG